MSKFVMSVALTLASFAGMSSAVKASEPVQPVQTAEKGQEESALLYGPYATYAGALVAAAYLQDLGYYTRIVISDGGWYYVQAW